MYSAEIVYRYTVDGREVLPLELAVSPGRLRSGTEITITISKVPSNSRLRKPITLSSRTKGATCASLLMVTRCSLEPQENVLIGKGHNHVGFYFFTAATVNNVKVYTKEPPNDLDLD